MPKDKTKLIAESWTGIRKSDDRGIKPQKSPKDMIQKAKDKMKSSGNIQVTPGSWKTIGE